MSCHQNIGQNHNVKTASKAIKYVAKFKYLAIQGMPATI